MRGGGRDERLIIFLFLPSLRIKTRSSRRIRVWCSKGSGWEPIFPRGWNKEERLRRESLCPVSRRAAAGVVVASHEGAWDGVRSLLYTRRGSDLRDQ